MSTCNTPALSPPSHGRSTAAACSRVNLRHYKGLGRAELRQLPEDLDQLWIGPSFDTGESIKTMHSIVDSLPLRLSSLDLDLTQTTATSAGMTAATSPPTAIDLSNFFTKQDVIELLDRMTNLRSLSLRLPPGTGDYGAAVVAGSFSAAAECPSAATAAATDAGGRSQRNNSLQDLDLRECHLGDAGIVALAEALESSSIKSLILSWSSTTSVGMQALATGLRKNPALERLDLGCVNGVNDESIADLLSSLRHNHNLKEVSFFCCAEVGEATGLRLLECLRGGADGSKDGGDSIDEDKLGYNTSLQKINLKGTNISPSTQNLIDYYLQLNRAGRKLLNVGAKFVDKEPAPHVNLSLWPSLLAKYTNAASLEPGDDQRRRKKKVPDAPSDTHYYQLNDVLGTPTATHTSAASAGALVAKPPRTEATDIVLFFVRNNTDLWHG